MVSLEKSEIMDLVWLSFFFLVSRSSVALCSKSGVTISYCKAGTGRTNEELCSIVLAHQ